MDNKQGVLVIDDDLAIREVLRAALADAGYEVLLAANGEALALARTQQPVVILLDLTRSLVSGVDLCRRLRAEPTTAHIPVVAMSGWRATDRPHVAALFDAWLDKPFDLEAVFATLARWTAAP